jgi:hypothetical protein
MPIRKVVEALAADRCIALFMNYGVTLVPATEPATLNYPLLYCGVMGYSGVGIRGSLAIAGSSELLTASNPTRRESAARDWAGELANQLTGHVKSGLLGYGVAVHLALPTVLRGEHLSLQIRGETGPLLFTDAARSGLIGIWMDVETAPGFVMASEEDHALTGMAPGEIIEF